MQLGIAPCCRATPFAEERVWSDSWDPLGRHHSNIQDTRSTGHWRTPGCFLLGTWRGHSEDQQRKTHWHGIPVVVWHHREWWYYTLSSQVPSHVPSVTSSPCTICRLSPVTMLITQLPVDVLTNIVSNLGWSDKVSLFRTAEAFRKIDSIRCVFCWEIGLQGFDETCDCCKCIACL